MCRSCLENKIECINEYDERINKYVLTLDCEGCKYYYSFLIGINIDFKVLCLTLMKKNDESNPNVISKLSTLEDLVLKRINHKMRSVLDAVEENSNGMKEGCYLNKMNDLKDFNDFLESIKRADHN